MQRILYFFLAIAFSILATTSWAKEPSPAERHKAQEKAES